MDFFKTNQLNKSGLIGIMPN